MRRRILGIEDGSILGNPTPGIIYDFLDSNNNNLHTIRNSSGVDFIDIRSGSAISLLLNDSNYQTDTDVSSAINTAISNLIDGSPGALDTLNELAAALGDDENFAATIASQQSAQDQAISLNTQKVSADGSVTDHNDVTNAGSGIIISTAERQELIDLRTETNALRRLTYRKYIDSSSGLINQTIAFEPYFVRDTITDVDNTGTWNWTVPFTGDFVLAVSFQFSINSVTVNFLSHVLVDGVDFEIPMHIETKDLAGVGIAFPTVAGNVVSQNTVNSGTDQFLLASGKKVLKNLQQGTQKQFRLEFANQTANQEACIYQATIEVYHINNNA